MHLGTRHGWFCFPRWCWCFIDNAAWAIHSTYHTVLKASPGTAIFGRDIEERLGKIRVKVNKASQHLYTNIISPTLTNLTLSDKFIRTSKWHTKFMVKKFFPPKFFPLESRLIVASFVGASVKGHGILVGNYLAKCCNLLISLSLMYVGDRQSLGIKMATSHKIQTWLNTDAHHIMPKILMWEHLAR